MECRCEIGKSCDAVGPPSFLRQIVRERVVVVQPIGIPRNRRHGSAAQDLCLFLSAFLRRVLFSN